MDRQWKVRERAPESYFRDLGHLPWPVAQLLHNREVTTPAEVDRFLAREVEEDNPFTMLGMYEAVTRIRDAIKRGEKIIVHGDFDADGVSSTAVMVTGLDALGAIVAPYIPHRVDEGYGLHSAAIHKMHERGVSLMVTVDCGIRASEEIALANQLGIDVIVTDHHSVPTTLPPAYSIVNPQQPGCAYPYKTLAGVGVAWKMVHALYLAERKRPIGMQRFPLDPKELLEFVALGTVADVAPMTGENRRLVWYGMQQLRQTQRPGIVALMESARIKPESVDSDTIGFFLGPRINAAGRLDHAKLAYKLLRARELESARRLAARLELLNRQRQEYTRQAVARAEAQIRDPSAPILFVSDNQCPEGIVGLVAGRLTERYYRPAIVIAQGPDHSRASCRSIDEFHITAALDRVSHLLERYGGHAAAAGFTVRNEQLPALQKALIEVAEEQMGDCTRLHPSLDIDAELPLALIDDALVEAIEELAPFGEQNRTPLWISRNVHVRNAWQVGSNGNHLKLSLLDEHHRPWSSIAFRHGSRYADLPPVLDIVFSIKRNEWRGRSELELQLEDFRAAEERVPAQ